MCEDLLAVPLHEETKVAVDGNSSYLDGSAVLTCHPNMSFASETPETLKDRVIICTMDDDLWPSLSHPVENCTGN